MKLIYFCLLLAVILLLGNGGGRIVTTGLVILIGTAVPIHLAIYLFLRFRVLHPMREAISTLFARLPMALGFSIIVVVGVAAIVAEVFLLQDFARPSDSWLLITLGFLLGIMGSVFHRLGRNRKNREQAAPLNGP